MRIVGWILALVGVLVSAVAAFWYWRISQFVPSFVGTPAAASLARTQMVAIGLGGFGILVVLIGGLIGSKTQVSADE